MKIDIKFIALLAIICLLSLSVVSAADDAQADVTADANDDIEIGDADTATNDTAASNAKPLERAANGVVINVADGDIVELDDDYELDKSIYIDNKITLDGKGHTLDGKNSVRIIAARTTDITLQNIIFKNGGFSQKDSGAGVWAKEGGITIINCTFINNEATDYGGAIYSPLGGNTIINCTFESNTAAQSGGAINFNANGNTIINNTFKNNIATANNGGALTITGQNTAGQNIIKGNTFENNKASKADAGALYLDKTNGDEISDNVFIKNSAIRGGAVSLYESGNFILKNNSFTSNAATELGGALRASITNSKSKTTISENTFKSNSAPNSGALHIDGSNVEINTNEFDGNKATKGYAGSMQINGNTIKILNNNIINTNAVTYGGAIVVKKGTSMTIQSNNITNANAKDGGAIFVETGAATIDSNNFTKCTATNFGGAIRAESKVTVTNNIFTDNTATKGSDIRIYNGDGSQVKNNNFVTYTANSIVTYGSVAIQDNKGFKEVPTITTLNKNYAITTTTKYLTVVLKNSKGTGIAGKNITITLNGKTYTGVTNAKGQYKTKIALSKVGKYTCNVNFAGDDSNTAAKLKFTIAVNKAATKISSPAKTFKKSATKKVVITLKSGKTLLKKQKVTIKINKKTYKGTTNNKGKATIKIKLTKKGTYKGVLKYATTAKYKACTGKVTIKVK